MNKKNIAFILIPVIVIIIAVICLVISTGIMNPLEHNIDLAIKELNKGNYGKSISMFDKAISIDDRSPDIFFAKANAELLAEDETAANASIEKALALLKYDLNKTEHKQLTKLLNSGNYKSEKDLMLYWLEKNNYNEEYSDLNLWLKKYLSSEYADDYEEIEQRLKKEEVNEALNKLINDKGIIEKVKDEREIIANGDEYMPLVLEEYYVNDGILSYYIDDFDKDGSENIFTAELKKNKLSFKLYEISNGKAIETDSKNVTDVLDNFVGYDDWTKVFIKEYDNDEIIAFCEGYVEGGLLSDGFSYEIKGYRMSNGKLIEVVNESGEGSAMSEYLDEVNDVLETYDLAPVLDDYYGMYTSVAESSDVEILAKIEQRFYGEADEVYENVENPSYIRPMVVTIDVNR